MKYAMFDPASPDPKPVMGWYDTEHVMHRNITLPPRERLLEVNDADWDARTANRFVIRDGKLEIVPPVPRQQDMRPSLDERLTALEQKIDRLFRREA